MKWKTIFYGVIANSECFVLIQKYSDVVSLWCVDELPRSMDEQCIQAFLDSHTNDGWSVSGTWEQIAKELKDMIDWSTIRREL